MNQIQVYIQDIIRICQLHRVKSLSVFGSILTPKFTEKSDIDFLVDFDNTDHEQWDYVSNYFDMRDSLEKLFQRPIDLIEDGDQLNPVFRASIYRQRHMIYG